MMESTYKFSSDWIHKLEEKRHWIYYWHQVNMISAELNPGDEILEIGVGTRFTSNYLKSKGYKVTTLDIDAEKKPDIVANIVDYKFEKNYDYILAFEVFEHIPFDEFRTSLKRLNEICNKKLLLSLPRNEKVWLNLSIELPGSKVSNFRIATRRKKIITKHHHWEVDYARFTNAFLNDIFTENGFSVESREKVFSLFFYSLKK